MIQADYYPRFVTMCKRNPKITRIPTKDELESAGCQLSGMSYLIEPNGRQCNPSMLNPEILSKGLVSLFIEQTTPPRYELSDHPIKAVDAGEPIVDNVVRTEIAGYVSIDKVREFVIEAYAMGRYDEKCGINVAYHERGRSEGDDRPL